MFSRKQIIASLAFLLLTTPFAASEDVLTIARAYRDGGGYDKTWRGTGVPEDVRFADTLILKKGNGSYCCGYTLSVVMKAAEDRGLLEGKKPNELRRFQKQWYGATEDSRETLCALAVETLGIGEAIEPQDARPGDFLQFWRTNGSGHSVVFIEWVGNGDKPIGFKYRSSQGSTDGIGDRTEFFADVREKGGAVDRGRLYFCRLAEASLD
jgi:hypothetical protein